MAGGRRQEVVSSASGGDVEVVVLMPKWWWCKIALRVAEKVHTIARKNVLWQGSLGCDE